MVVEPHSDDAWLSLGQHLLDWQAGGEETAIVTVYGTARRMEESRTYANYVGAKHLALAIPEGGFAELPSGILEQAIGEADMIIGPLGIKHPEHLAVAAAMPAEALHYVDLPYALKQANAEATSHRIHQLRVVSWKPRSAKANAASSIFKSQSKFWHYNREDLIGAVEVIVAPL